MDTHWHSYKEDPQNAGLHTVIEGEDGYQEKSVFKKSEVDGAPMYESAGPIPQLSPLEKDPQAPKDRLEPSDPGNYQTKVTDPTGPGGKEATVGPLIRSFEKMEVSEEPGEHEPWSSTGSHDQFSPDLPPPKTKTIGDNTQAVPKSFDASKPDIQSQATEVQEQPNRSSYAEKISYATSTIAEKAKSAKNAVASKLGYRGNDGTTEGGKAGSAEVSEMQGTETGTGKGTEREGEAVGRADKGVSVKEYVVKKLRPSDEDKALSEVILEAFYRRKGEEMQKVSQEQGKVTELPEVVKQLGSDHKDNTPEGLSSSNEAGKGMMGRLKGAVTCWFGKNREQQQHQHTSQASHSSSPGGDEVCQENQDIAGERKLIESTN